MELKDEERKYSVNMDYSSNEDKRYCGLSKRRLTLVVGAVLLILLIVIVLVVVVLLVHSNKSEDEKSLPGKSGCNEKRLPDPIILISMDGFRPDYLDRNMTPNINYLASNGVRAKFLVPQFPTKTFPSHYSIATGLWPSP
ncbi:hypothetical protein OS493_039579 [Desmophyllum pertusum]|uniref:Ectonucleotide pyrophosphatase/phosphodiesterase family member 6 n=1 Tax=Desmophyllum pertusum TaxID=174260 RepID=A0A9W9YH46_9CNID|nr:hypothetical protein OS493_039579 [Desmophyllum pertusum]